MRFRNTIISILCIAIAVGSLGVGSMRLESINDQRERLRLVSNEPLKNAPPSLAFATVSLGAFRGLLVNILWVRADRLKQEGQFFDARQLAEWITTLQPRFAEVWDFHAWNMAYNISVAMPASQPHERWRWVRNGYELLRDRGIPLNPNSILLYRSLAWIFHHKIGGVTDDVHKYYKLQLYIEMNRLIDPEAGNAFFEELIEAPRSMAELLVDEEVAAIVSELRSLDEGFADNGNFATYFIELREAPRPDNLAWRVMDDNRNTEAYRKLDMFCRAYKLRNEWKFDIELMHRLNRDYGPRDYEDPEIVYPLSWNNPQVHAMYWATKGLMQAAQGVYNANEVNTDRIVFHSMQELYRRGHTVVYESEGDYYSLFQVPDLRMFEACNDSYKSALDKWREAEGVLSGTLVGMEAGHRNFLINSAFSFYQAGHIRYAERIYRELGRLYPEHGDFDVPLATFVRNRMAEEFEDLDFTNAVEAITLMLRNAYFRYAIRDDNMAASMERMAQEAYRIYERKYAAGDVEVPGVTARLAIGDFAVMRYLALVQFINDELYPPEMRMALFNRMEAERPELMQELRDAANQLEQRIEQQAAPSRGR